MYARLRRLIGQYEGDWIWAKAVMAVGYKVRRHAWVLKECPVWITKTSDALENLWVRSLYGRNPLYWTPHPSDEAATDWEIYE